MSGQSTRYCCCFWSHESCLVNVCWEGLLMKRDAYVLKTSSVGTARSWGEGGYCGAGIVERLGGGGDCQWYLWLGIGRITWRQEGSRGMQRHCRDWGCLDYWEDSPSARTSPALDLPQLTREYVWEWKQLWVGQGMSGKEWFQVRNLPCPVVIHSRNPSVYQVLNERLFLTKVRGLIELPRSVNSWWVMGMSVGTGEWEMSMSFGVYREDLLLLRWTQRWTDSFDDGKGSSKDVGRAH